MTIPTFETVFAVPLSCNTCIKDVSTSLYNLQGIEKVSADLQEQLVSVHGTAPPSSIVAAIQATGRDAILRGTGQPNSAAVCILETHSAAVTDYVRGLVRMVQVAPNLTIIDLSIRGLSPGTYHATIRETGDISRGPESTGGIWDAVRADKEKTPIRGILGTVEVSQGGLASIFLDRPIQIWEMIGRSIVVSKKVDGGFDKQDPDTLVGVIARSAGVWDNDKTVCSCSGKTVWEERKEQADRAQKDAIMLDPYIATASSEPDLNISWRPAGDIRAVPLENPEPPLSSEVSPYTNSHPLPTFMIISSSINEDWSFQKVMLARGQSLRHCGVLNYTHLHRASFYQILGYTFARRLHSMSPETGALFGKLYGYEDNPRSRGIIVAAKANGLNLDIVRSVPREGFSESYLKLNKLGRIPTFEGSDGFILHECIAIAIYVAQQNNKARLLGETKQDYASILQWMSFFNTDLQNPLGRWWRMLINVDEYEDNLVKMAQLSAYQALDVVEAHLHTRTYLVGDRITLADFFCAGMLSRGFACVLDKLWRSDHPSITRWYQSVVNQPVYIDAVGESKMIDEMMERVPLATG